MKDYKELIIANKYPLLLVLLGIILFIGLNIFFSSSLVNISLLFVVAGMVWMGYNMNDSDKKK